MSVGGKGKGLRVTVGDVRARSGTLAAAESLRLGR